jgi:hypothetical protein
MEDGLELKNLKDAAAGSSGGGHFQIFVVCVHVQ